MDFSVALTIVQTLLELLDSSNPLRREIESVRGYKKLENTISTIQDVMLEAEKQQLQLSIPQKGILKRLNEVLYEVDDLLDEVATLVQRKKFMSGNDFHKEVSIFFSRFNQIKYAFTKCREIRKIRESLDDIAKDNSLFGSIVPQQTGGGRTSQIYLNGNPRETGSLLNEEDVIIGRGVDKRVVIDMLVCTPAEERVCCVSIVGIGGLGKTTLAQLVYNNRRITREFELKMWVCVSNDFDVKALLADILAAATKKPKEDLSMDRLQTRIQEELHGKKYLLVLDDLWDDVTSKWDRLKTPLIGGRRGSRILISTRSQVVANTVGGLKHELKGLSEAESWKLFERMTLLSRQEMEALNGEKILKKCANVPLAIRVIGSYLRGQSQGKWTHMGNIDLANDESIEDIVSLLMISYYDLPFQLKRCFSYCAIFPKDYEIIKEDLISLWMAQGFIQTKGRSLEDVGDEYFMNLLHRCFFQDIECADDGEIISCKMHDLIHDVAKIIVGTEMMLVKNDTSNLNAEVYHVFSESENAITFPAQMKRMRTLLIEPHQRDYYSIVNNNKIPTVESLRVLSCTENGIIKVPKRIGELIHLRYLDLSDNPFRLLPPSITNLFNLQTLKLRYCSCLEKLPDDLGKLVNLRVLDLYNCDGLRNMPLGMRRLTFLHKLTYFALGNPKYDSTKALENLKCLKSLTGTLLFNIHGDWTCDVAEVREGGYLSELEQLKKIGMRFQRNAKINSAQALLNGLQPNHNLRKVYFRGCPRVRLPSWWGRGILSKNPKSYLPELVEIHLCACSVLELFPSMSQLPKLRVLRLRHLFNIEYIESSNNGDVDSTDLTGSPPGEAYEESVFFPSLQILQLENLPNLKGWGLLHSNTYVFPQLKSLDIIYCKRLASLPLCPQGGSFHICDVESLSFRKSLTCSRQRTPENCRVDITSVNVGYIINSLPIDIFEHLSHLEITKWNEIKRLKPVELSDLFQSRRVCSLLSLKIFNCKELRNLSELEEMWEYLPALKTLIFQDIANSKLEWEEDGDYCRDSGEHKGVEGEIREEDNRDSVSAFDKPWAFLAPTLRRLTLSQLPKLVRLPRGMHRLTSLHSLEIYSCDNLEELPAWIGCFMSLHSLQINDCQKLKWLPQEMCQLTSLERLSLECHSEELRVRCQEPNGADWPKIQHIPIIKIV